MQSMLSLLLNACDRETISGDLSEEYREERLPRLGRTRANYWYLRQVVSFASIQIVGGPPMKQALVLMSLLIIATGTWLWVMENVLKHDGYRGRSVVAACIAMQGLATLLLVLLHRNAVLRGVVMIGAVAIILFGGSAILRILRAPHFEGFVLLAGLALILQGGLTLATLVSSWSGRGEAHG
jgi:hypothetical protein